jgi:hypothetical protein
MLTRQQENKHNLSLKTGYVAGFYNTTQTNLFDNEHCFGAR